MCSHGNTSTGICWLISMTHSLKPSLSVDTKHGSQQRTAQPTPLIYHVNFSNSPCSPCWPDNPCRQLQTSHTDRNGNGSWGSAQCVSGYDTPVNQMEMPRCASQGAVVRLLLPKGAADVISLSALLHTSQITDTTSFYYCLIYWNVSFHTGQLEFPMVLICSSHPLIPRSHCKLLKDYCSYTNVESGLMCCQSHSHAHGAKMCDGRGGEIKTNPLMIYL